MPVRQIAGGRTSKRCRRRHVCLPPESVGQGSLVTKDHREVGTLSRRVMLPRVNPYPADYQRAFACSRILYPPGCQVVLRRPFRGDPGVRRAYHVPQA